MLFEHTRVFNINGAMRGMRNPMNSWAKADTLGEIVGNADRELALKLIKAGPTHRKFMRQILICVDITASMNWWRQFDTYKVGTVANSCSTMHRLVYTPITSDMFEHNAVAPEVVDYLEGLRRKCKEKVNTEEGKILFRNLIDNLPLSFMQKRTVTLNYEVLWNIAHTRKGEKLSEWEEVFTWMDTLPNKEFIYA